MFALTLLYYFKYIQMIFHWV